MNTIILEKSKNIENLLINIRRHLHKYPELSSQEFETTKFIQDILSKNNIKSEHLKTNAGPAVIANLYNGKDKTLVLRADIDALPLFDKKDVEYKSANDGVMHACGHDFHTTVVLGAALVLNEIKDKLNVNVRFIFQPAEEVAESGAKAVIESKVLKNTHAIWTIHALPTLETGKIGLNNGAVTAANDAFHIKVIGKGGHSARPHLTTDSIFIANQILNYLYADLPRRFDPIEPLVLSIGSIKGGSAPNIISESCEISGTLRTFSKEIRNKLPELMADKLSKMAKTFGAQVEAEWLWGPPPAYNHPKTTKIVEKTATELYGKENVEFIEKPSMGADDFAWYLDYIPGTLIRIGTGSKNTSYPLHNNMFDVDEKAIKVAVDLLAKMVVDFKD